MSKKNQWNKPYSIDCYVTCIFNFVIESDIAHKKELDAFFKKLCEYLEEYDELDFFDDRTDWSDKNPHYFIASYPRIDYNSLIEYCDNNKPECVNLFYQITDFKNKKIVNNDTNRNYFIHEYVALFNLTKNDADALGYTIEEDIIEACYFEKSEESLKSKYYTYGLDIYHDISGSLPDELSEFRELQKKLKELNSESYIKIYKYKERL